MEELISPFQHENDAHLRPARRRAQERPIPGEPLALESAEVKEVMDIETGRHLHISVVMGTDYEDLMQRRMAARIRMRKESRCTGARSAA
jgi:hypothetical protein